MTALAGTIHSCPAGTMALGLQLLVMAAILKGHLLHYKYTVGVKIPGLELSDPKPLMPGVTLATENMLVVPGSLPKAAGSLHPSLIQCCTCSSPSPFSLPSGALSQVVLMQSEAAVKKPGESHMLQCATSGLTLSSYWMNWVQQVPRRGMEWLL